MHVAIQTWYGEEAPAAYYRCRAEVFGAELAGRPARDRFDPSSLHFLACVDGQPAGCGRLISGELQSIARFPAGGLPADLTGWREPSRVGLVAAVRGTKRGATVFLALVGRIVEAGFGDAGWLLTQFGRVYNTLRWWPFTLFEPIRYEENAEGPVTRLPIWPAVVNPREIAAATWYLRPQHWAGMFPHHDVLPTWTDIRSPESLGALETENKRFVQITEQQFWIPQAHSPSRPSSHAEATGVTSPSHSLPTE